VRSKWKIGGGGQLRPVLILLAVAVILPTVCLLWFMNRAVENVRMASRQMLINTCNSRVAGLAGSINKVCSSRKKIIEKDAHRTPIEHFSFLVLGEPAASSAVIYDSSGKPAYPIVAAAALVEPELPKEFEDAWQLEFVQRNYVDAAIVNNIIAESTQHDYLWRKATLGMVRCYRALGDMETARDLCRDVGYQRIGPEMPVASLSLVAGARVMLAQMNGDDVVRTTAFSDLLSTTTDYNPASNFMLPMDSGTRIFIQQRAIKMAEKDPDANRHADSIEKAKRLLAAEELAAEVAQHYADASSFSHWKVGSVHRLDVSSDVYGLYCKAADKSFLVLRSGADIRRDFDIFEESFAGSDILYRVLDDKGAYVGGVRQPLEKAFITPTLGQSFAGWRVELYLKDADVLARKASREVAVYTWTAVLVIVMILLAGGFAGQSIGKQIRLNRLKNDFIATVSHELKTPLASMRVLVDTLLEGRYRDQQQVTDYLRLVSRENERLTGLIDNFLTFSRMERNKQAFEFESVSPAVIARHAADAVKTRFGNGKCRFDVSVGENLPDVLADRDAMVTVLINLLDNAYKYSYDEKRIELRVSSEDGSVCFCVSDSGVGLSRRAVKKIFNRFYQVDRSLTRSAEGCGLGLSIVKFIVDAHKGKISVDSKPGKGSTFTVKLPAGNE
jgi:signal transduction histidine kinase